MASRSARFRPAYDVLASHTPKGRPALTDKNFWRQDDPVRFFAEVGVGTLPLVTQAFRAAWATAIVARLPPTRRDVASPLAESLIRAARDKRRRKISRSMQSSLNKQAKELCRAALMDAGFARGVAAIEERDTMGPKESRLHVRMLAVRSLQNRAPDAHVSARHALRNAGQPVPSEDVVAVDSVRVHAAGPPARAPPKSGNGARRRGNGPRAKAPPAESADKKA